MVNATDCRSVSWGFDSLPRLILSGFTHLGWGDSGVEAVPLYGEARTRVLTNQ